MTDPTNVTGSLRSLRVIASSDAPILVQGDGVVVQLRIDSPAVVALASEQAAHAGDASLFRFYLMLEHVRGTHDATVLQAFLRTQSSAHAGHPQDTYLASVGLFGLRRASSDDSSEGLLYSLDITSHAALLQNATVPVEEFFCVSIRPRHALPGGVAIHIGRLCICVEHINA
ncbi:DUF7868 domain-containing protein [Burkholderia ubonensis]|uniref:DUF7868 domain-containing protein n=1 Tax=Burkholderia ubonensis subsp. mesacidophila TaxID=265293 RepID=A0A2A4FBF6_9BURK|nr:hypothetical protein [Burkholderia ubonensis]PCE30701.1 hypothetical protein BZL54_19555 [Burkholderia ubonensis subsp. mesacidophila]